MADLVYTRMVFGDVALLSLPLELAVWVLFVALSYALALLIASILDPLVLGNIQKLFNSRFVSGRKAIPAEGSNNR